MSHDSDESKVARSLVALMERGLADQDAETCARLAAARRRALQQRSQPGLLTWVERWRNWGLGGALLATAMSVTVMIFIDTPSFEPVDGDIDSVELAVLAGDAELYADIEFYFWLEQQDESLEL